MRTLIEGFVAVKGVQSDAGADRQQLSRKRAGSERGQRVSSDRARELVFENWTQIDGLCKRRFPANENLAHEALLFVLKQLEANDWHRIGQWQGSGRFLTFLATLVSRLLTDFSRKKFGHIRMPKWLSAMTDPVWKQAWRLLIVEDYKRQEVVNLLQTYYPTRERWFFEEVTSTIQARCHSDARAAEESVSIEQCAEIESHNSAPEMELSINNEELLEALCEFIRVQNDRDNSIATERVNQLVVRLRAHVKLEDEDRMLLRLRFVDGVKMTEIVNLLSLKGDPYKRMHKVLRSLRDACDKAGLMDVLQKD